MQFKRVLILIFRIIQGMRIQKKLIVFQNPYSGEKKTRSVFNHEILPLLETTNFELDIFGNFIRVLY
jgi:hypothetical protein